MNKLEEFLEQLDNRNKIMLYVSVVVVAIIIFYNFNYAVLSAEIDENSAKIDKLNKEVHFSLNHYNAKLVNLKKTSKKLVLKENEKLQDLDYLNKRLNLSILNVDDKKFYSILENILSKTSALNLTPSFSIDKNMTKFNKYEIKIDGVVQNCSEAKLFNLIKILESGRYVSNIDKFSIDKNSSTYSINYNIWGIK